jgi:signal transduction histidine kinase
LAVRLEPAPSHTIAGELGYGTGQGAHVEGSWTDRNFWNPEGALTLRGILGTTEQLAGVQLRRSNFVMRDQTLNVQFSASHQKFAAYTAKTIDFAANLERQSELHLDQVTRTQQDLQQLSARLLQIQEDERKRLSCELHDEIGQILHALRIEISQARAFMQTDSAAAGASLEHARGLAENVVGTVRNISVLLRPPLLDDLGLAPALQWLAEDFSRRAGIRCSLAEQGLPQALPDAQRTCVYRVVQEALHNCDKHSGASNVRLTARAEDAQLIIEIEDDGRGFDAAAQRKPAGTGGLGLLGMRERASMLGGSFAVDSAPGTGTRLTMRLPLPEPAGEARRLAQEAHA